MWWTVARATALINTVLDPIFTAPGADRAVAAGRTAQPALCPIASRFSHIARYCGRGGGETRGSAPHWPSLSMIIRGRFPSGAALRSRSLPLRPSGTPLSTPERDKAPHGLSALMAPAEAGQLGSEHGCRAARCQWSSSRLSAVSGLASMIVGACIDTLLLKRARLRDPPLGRLVWDWEWQTGRLADGSEGMQDRAVSFPSNPWHPTPRRVSEQSGSLGVSFAERVSVSESVRIL